MYAEVLVGNVNSLSEADSLARLPGIGRRTPRALARYGMKTIGNFAMLSESEAFTLLGASGVRLLRLAREMVG
jgi:nucleotidyltransferase/DNA polymerase involved in DNA repair